MNLGELIALIKRRVGGDIETEPRLTLVTLINNAYTKIVMESQVCRGIQEFTYTAAGFELSVFQLNPTVRKVVTVEWDGSVIEMVGPGNYADDPGSPCVASVWANRVQLWPNCDAEQEGKKLRLHVVRGPDDTLNLDADVPASLPANFHQALVEYPVSELLQMPRYKDLGLSDRAAAKFRREVQDVKSHVNTNLPPVIDGGFVDVYSGT